MLGNDSFFSTHEFRFVFIWDVLQRIRIARASMGRINEDDSDINNRGNTDVNDCEEPDASDRQAERIVLDGDGNVTAITQYDKYVNKGQHFQVLSLYDYVATIKMIRVKKKQASSVPLLPHRFTLHTAWVPRNSLTLCGRLC